MGFDHLSMPHLYQSTWYQATQWGVILPGHIALLPRSRLYCLQTSMPMKQNVI